MKEKNFPFWLYYLTGVAVFLLPAFYNGFPLMYADLGTYIRSGFMPETPIDRPITYGLFIRLFSFNGLFIWSVVAVQVIALLWGMRLFCKPFFPELNAKQQTITLIPLALLSPVSWRLSELQPDILSAVCLLLIMVLLLKNEALKKSERITCFILYFILNSVHLSHLTLHLLLLAFLLAAWFLFRKKISLSFRNWILIFILTFNHFLISGSSIDKSRHIFQMSALAENGVLYDFLSDECRTQNYSLCKYKERLKEITGSEFIYAPYGPVVQSPGWLQLKPEYNKIISKIFSTLKYIRIFLFNSILQTREQFSSFNIGDGNIIYEKGSAPYDAMNQFMPLPFKQYLHSREYEDRLKQIFPFWQVLHRVVFWISLILLPACIFLPMFRKQLLLIVITILFTLLANAWTVTTFSCSSDRFQSKYTWMVVWIVLLAIIQQARRLRDKKVAL